MSSGLECMVEWPEKGKLPIKRAVIKSNFILKHLKVYLERRRRWTWIMSMMIMIRNLGSWLWRWWAQRCTSKEGDVKFEFWPLADFVDQRVPSIPGEDFKGYNLCRERLIHSVFICLSSITQSFFLFFTFFMTSIAFKVHINDNWKICPPPFFILKALGAIWWTKWVQKDQNVQVCELSGSGCSKLVELCGTRLQQVRACPGRCIGTISRMRSGHRRCHRPS